MLGHTKCFVNSDRPAKNLTTMNRTDVLNLYSPNVNHVLHDVGRKSVSGVESPGSIGIGGHSLKTQGSSVSKQPRNVLRLGLILEGDFLWGNVTFILKPPGV